MQRSQVDLQNRRLYENDSTLTRFHTFIYLQLLLEFSRCFSLFREREKKYRRSVSPKGS